MTREEAQSVIMTEQKCVDRASTDRCNRDCANCDLIMDDAVINEAYNMAIKALEQPELCDDAVSRAEIVRWTHFWFEAVDIKPDRFIAGIKRLPSVTPKQRWIPVTERLPEKGNEVLVCYDFKGWRSVMTGDLWGDGKFHGFDEEYLTPEGRKYRKAVAWMPLPEPYREEGDE